MRIDTAFAETAISVIDNPEFTGEVAFLCQQAIEKYFKAFLFENKIPFKKTHDLIELYKKVKDIKDLNLDEDLLKEITTLYIETRYPTDVALLDDFSLPSKEKANSYFELAKKVSEIVKGEIAFHRILAR